MLKFLQRSKGEGSSGRGFIAGLTPRALLASILCMLLAAIYTQYSAVLLCESYFIAEAALPVPAMIVLILLVLFVSLLAALFKLRLLTRAEIVCVAFTMMFAVPMVTQGFWHRFLGITSAPLRTSSFHYLDAYNDNLWPHGPNLVKETFLEASILKESGVNPKDTAGVQFEESGNVVWESIEYKERQIAFLPVLSNSEASEESFISFTIPIDCSSANSPVPGNPHLVSVLARSENMEQGSQIFCRSFSDNSAVPNTLFLERSANKKTYLHRTGFTRLGAYGKVLATDCSSNFVVQFGLTGRGKVEFVDPKIMSVAALEGAFQGRHIITESEYSLLPYESRPAGVVIRPDRMWSLKGLTFILKGYIPLREWVRPAMVWSAYILLLCGAFFAANVIMRRKWADAERYPMPNAKIPLGIIGADDEDQTGAFAGIWSNKFMWAGFVFAFIYGGMKGLHYFNPRLPDLGVEIKLGEYIADPMWGGMFDVSFIFSLFIVSIAVFFELNVLLSIVLGYWACRIILMVGYVTDIRLNTGFPWRDQQAIGAYIGYFLIVLILSRRHLWIVLKEAIKGEPRKEGEVMSSRASVLMLILCHAGVVLWAKLAGATPTSMLLMFAFLVMLGFISAKIRAECGSPFGYFTPYNAMLFVTLCGGMTVFGAEGLLVSLILSGFLTVTVFYLLPGMQFEMIEIGRRMRIRPRDIAGTCLLGVLGGLFIGGWVFLSNAYSIGGDNIRFQWAFNGLNWFMDSYNRTLNETTTIWLREEAGTELTGGMAPGTRIMLVWGGITVVLTVLRQFFSGFWFHPIGFLLGTTNLNSGANWGSLLVAWGIRCAVLKIGGATAVTKKMQPFFIGVFMGCVASIAMFTIINGYALKSGSIGFYYGIP